MDVLAGLDEMIAAASPAERVGLVVQLAARLAALGAGLARAEGPPAPITDANMSVEAAAARLGMSRRYLYAHADELGGLRLGRRLLFPARALDQLIARKAAK